MESPMVGLQNDADGKDANSFYKFLRSFKNQYSKVRKCSFVLKMWRTCRMRWLHHGGFQWTKQIAVAVKPEVFPKPWLHIVPMPVQKDLILLHLEHFTLISAPIPRMAHRYSTPNFQVCDNTNIQIRSADNLWIFWIYIRTWVWGNLILSASFSRLVCSFIWILDNL